MSRPPCENCNCARRNPEPEKRCDASLVLDFDAVNCNLPLGHDGRHRDSGEGGVFEWSPITEPEATDD